MIEIGAPSLLTRGGWTYLTAMVTTNKRSEQLWFSVPEEYGALICPTRLDPFLLAILFRCLADNAPLRLHGTVSAQLYDAVVARYVPIACAMNPKFSPVTIDADELTSEPVSRDRRGVGLGFSAGVDSLAAWLEDEQSTAAHKVSHLIFSNVGSHGEWDAMSARELFLRRGDLMWQCAGDMGKRLVVVDSNISGFLNLYYPHSHTPRLLAAAYALQQGIERYLYASSVDYKWTQCVKGPGVEYADAVVVPLLATDSFRCELRGAQWNRPEKLRHLATHPIARAHLNVCTSGTAHNCCNCEKCLRTICLLEQWGVRESFRNVFPHNPRSHRRLAYYARIFFAQRTVYDREMRRTIVSRFLSPFQRERFCG